MTTMRTFISLPMCLAYMNTTEDLASMVPVVGGMKISLSVSMSTSTSFSAAFPVLIRAYVSSFSHFTSQGGGLFCSFDGALRFVSGAFGCGFGLLRDI